MSRFFTLSGMLPERRTEGPHKLDMVYMIKLPAVAFQLLKRLLNTFCNQGASNTGKVVLSSLLSTLTILVTLQLFT